jgi:hypothetical protein
MSEKLQSQSLQEADSALSAIPITSGILGRKIGLARSTLEIVEQRFISEEDRLDQACFALFLSYFAHEHNYDFDETGTFAHVQSIVGGDFATEHGMENSEYWPIRESADKITFPYVLLDGLGYVDGRYQSPDTWPNPIIRLGLPTAIGRVTQVEQ